MKTLPSLLMAAILGTTLALPAGWAFAQAATPPATPPATAAAAQHEGPLHKLFEGLNLTADQKAKIKDIVGPFHEKLSVWRTQNKTQLEALREQIKTARAAHDRAALKTAFQQLKQLRETAPKFKDILPEIKAVLTPEQVKILQERLEKVRDRLEEARTQHQPAATAPTK